MTTWQKILSLICVIAIGVCPVLIGFIEQPWLKAWFWLLVIILIVAILGQTLLVGFNPGPEKRRNILLAELAETTQASFDSACRMCAQTPGAIQRSNEERYNKLASELRASLLTRHGGARVQVFLVSRTDHEKAEPVAEVAGFAGRSAPSDPFKGGTARGDAAFRFIEGGQSYVCTNIKKDPPMGWQGTKSDYRSFMSCPVVGRNNVGLGMVTVDFRQPTALTPGDEAILQIFAGHVSVVRSIDIGRDGLESRASRTATHRAEEVRS